jgi:PAS domain S-box-containing protein
VSVDRLLAILKRVYEAANASFDLNEVLAAALAATLEAFAKVPPGPAEGGVIYLFDEAGQMFMPEAWQGLEPPILAELTGFKLGEGVTGAAAAGRRPVIVPDLREEPNSLAPSAPGFGWRSLVSVPLQARRQVVGAMSILSRTPARFASDDARLLNAIGYPVGAAIQNAFLFGESAARGEEARYLRDLNEGIVQSVSEAILLEDRAGHIRFANPAAERLLDWPRAELIGRHWSELVEPEQRAAIEARMGDRKMGRDDHYETVLRARDGHAVPVLVGVRPFLEKGRYAGTLSAFTDLRELKAEKEATREAEAQRETALGQRQDALAQREAALADREDALRDLAQREGELRARDAERAALYDTLLAITSPRELPELLRAIVEQAVALLKSSSGALFLVDGEGKALRGVVSYRMPMDPVGTVLPYGEGAAEVVAATGRPLIVNDFRDWSSRASTLETAHPYAAVLCAPMWWQDQLIGVIDVFHHEEPSHFTEADLDLLALFADQAAIAVGKARLLEAERAQRAQAEALRDTAAALAGMIDFNDLLERILELAARVVPYDTGTFMLIEDGIARPVQNRGCEELGVSAALANVRLRVADTRNLRHVMETGRVLAIPDVHSYSGFVWPVGLDWIASMICAPVRSKGQIVGFLNLSSRQKGFMNEAHAEALQAFADQAAIAIDNARLLGAERAQRAQAEALRDTAAALASTLDLQEVVERILDLAARVVPYDAGSVMAIENGVARPIYGRGYAEHGSALDVDGVRLPVASTPNLRHVVETGQALAIPDTHRYPGWLWPPGLEWIGSSISAPIRSKGEIIGFLTLDSAQPGFMTAAHAGSLRAFADQAAIAIANARLLEAERAQRAQAEALRDTAEALASTLDFDEVLERILEQAARVVPYDAATIMLIEDGTARVVRSVGYAERGLDSDALGVRLRVADHANLRLAAETHRPATIPDTRAFAEWKLLPATAWIGSAVCVPIRSKGQVIGFLNLDCEHPGSFTPADGEALLAFADQMAVAVENSELHDALQRHAAQLEQRVAERTAELAQREEALLETTAELQVANQALSEASQSLADLERLKSQFLANASHELRTPVTNIKTYLDLLEHGKPQRRDHYMTVLQRQANLLRQLVEGLLDVASLDFGRTQPRLALLDLNELVRDTLPGCAELIADRNVQLVTGLNDAPLYVRADQKMLRLVLTHLVSNAAERTVQGGSVWVNTGAAQEGSESWVNLSVRDAGQGIEDEGAGAPEEAAGGTGAASPASPAASSAPGIAPGQGLRLAICQEMVRSHGGRITSKGLRSGAGTGNTFTVWLPGARGGRE